MKAHQISSKFEPVTVTLESQDEVDMLYAILNFGPIVDGTALSEAFEVLLKFASDDRHGLHQELVKRLKDWGNTKF